MKTETIPEKASPDNWRRKMDRSDPRVLEKARVGLLRLKVELAEMGADLLKRRTDADKRAEGLRYSAHANGVNITSGEKYIADRDREIADVDALIARLQERRAAMVADRSTLEAALAHYRGQVGAYDAPLAEIERRFERDTEGLRKRIAGLERRIARRLAEYPALAAPAPEAVAS